MKSTLIFLSILLATPMALASGGSSSGGGGGGSYNYGTPQARQVDEAYEYGKSLYNGRSREVEKVKYCVTGEEEGTPVKRSSLRPFKGQTYNELASNLYDCNNPDKALLDYVSSSQAAHIIYYLDKRYKLSLQQ